MRSIEQVKQEMEKRLENLESRRNRLNGTITSLNQKRAQVCQEIGRLQGAIAALDGQQVPGATECEAHQGVGTPIVSELQPILDELKKRGINVDAESGVPKEVRDALAETPKTDELPPAEPGFRWVKNSFGEDCLVPEGLPAEMAEPPAAGSGKITTTKVMTPVQGGFDSPESMF